MLLAPDTIEVLGAHRRHPEQLSDSPDGAEPWQPNQLTQALERLRDRAGYTGRLHDLRHRHASQLLEAVESAVVVAERLGHGDSATTHRWYAHMMPAADQRASIAIGKALTKSGGETDLRR